MDASSLQRFVVIVESGSLSKAATRLGVTQPALTRTLQMLETHYGEQLVQRSASGVALTAFGQAVLTRAKLINAELRNLESEINALRSLATGQVNIGIPSGIGFTSEVLPAATLALATAASKLEIAYTIGTHDDLLTSLRRGDLDFLIADTTVPGDTSDLVQEALFRDHMGLFVRADHPLTQRRRLSVTDLASFTWSVLSDSSALEVSTRAAMAALGAHHARSVTRSNSALFVRSIVTKSDAIGFMSLDAAHPGVNRNLMIELRMADDVMPAPPLRQLGLIHRRDSLLSPLAQALIAQIRLHCSRLLGAAGGASGDAP